MTRPDDGMWFVPKRFGYGAGLPVAWQGWVVLIGMIAATFGAAAVWARTRPEWTVMTVIGINLVCLPLIRAKTRGGWKWRNGRE